MSKVAVSDVVIEELGFKPYIAASAWQVPVETLRAYVDGS